MADPREQLSSNGGVASRASAEWAAADPIGRPLVSVVIPTWNRWPFLQRAVGSALGQEGVDLEVLVIDDGSADGTPGRLRAAALERVRLIVRPSNGGVSSARNIGIAAARGEWIAFLDDDDVWAPDKLRRQLEIAAPGVSFIYAAAVLLDVDGAMIGLTCPAPPSELEPGLFRANLVGSPSSVIVRTEVVRSLGGFDESLSVLADWDMWIRLLLVGPAAMCPEPLLGYTVHAHNMHIADPPALRRELGVLRARYRQACRERGVALGGLNFSRWLAGRYRSNGMRAEAARLYLQIGLRHARPSDVARAAGILLGEGAMRLGRGRGDAMGDDEPADEPAWLRALRDAAGAGAR